MASAFDTARLTRLKLFFSGTALMPIDLYGVIEEYIHNGWLIVGRSGEK